MINLVFGVYSKTGTLLLGPATLGTLWAGFAVPDCTDPSGDPIVVYDQLADRWLLTQFTTAGPEFYNCVAISTTGDPTGSYYRYAFRTGLNFPDYPKYGVWRTPTSSRPVSSGRPSSTASASTPSRRTRWSTATRTRGS